MPKKPNYDFEKRRKELERQKKKEAKREDRARRRAGGESTDDVLDESTAADADPDQAPTV